MYLVENFFEKGNYCNFINRNKGANFMACASWKCSSTYWERFNKALLNATGTSNVTKADIMNDDNAIKGEIL